MSQSQMVRNLSLGEYFLRRYQNVARPYTFSASNADEFETWKEAFGARLAEAMGPLPEACDLDPITLERVDAGSYWREKVLFNAEPDMAVVAYVLVPKDLAAGERRPAILAAHGHGNGKDDVCRIDHGESDRVDKIAELNYGYAVELVERGYVVIAPDCRGFGERRLGGSLPPRDSCNVLFNKAMLFGINLLTLNVWDAMQSITYLQSRPEVDPDRIGCVGLSYGGTMTLFTTAMDERIKCAVVSCYLNSFGAFALGRGNFCGAQIPPGLLADGDMSDVACLIGPRPLLVESGIRDTGFPIAASRKAAADVRRCYEAAGVSERFDVDEFDAGHRWSGRKAYDWLEKWL